MNDIGVIPVSGKKQGFILVDAEHFPWLNTARWFLDSGGYPSCNTWNKEMKKARSVRMHTIIHRAPKGMQVDHENGFRFDNRSRNLRTVDQPRSSQNTGVQSRPKTSKFKGVSWRSDTENWTSYIKQGGKKYSLGSFHSEIAAAEAYNRAAIKRFGEFARLNDLGVAPAIIRCGVSGGHSL
jgi:hypothetical protein